MGRKNKKYKKSLRDQAYAELTQKLAFGESKKAAKEAGTDKGKIFSYETYRVYWKHIKYFIDWMKEKYPQVTSLKEAEKYVPEWLAYRTNECTNSRGEPLSAWTIQTEAAALNKLFGVDKADVDRFQPPVRHRADIRRSRVEVPNDKHFSVTNNDELIRFCRGTGCRRNVLQRIQGKDYWTRTQMENKAKILSKKGSLAEDDRILLENLKLALETFPDQDDFLYHRKDKGGKSRFAPIVGPDKDRIIARLKETKPDERVWGYVNKNADIHGYRAHYASRVYTMYRRPIESIPYDKVNPGTGHRYQSEVYHCRLDEAGKKLDRLAMLKVSRALGHNRVDVVATSYLRGI